MKLNFIVFLLQILSIRIYVFYNSRYSNGTTVSTAHNRSIKRVKIPLINEEKISPAHKQQQQQPEQVETTTLLEADQQPKQRMFIVITQ